MEFSQQTVQDLIQNKMRVLFLCTISLRVKPFSSEFHNKEQTQKSSNKHVGIRLFLHHYKFQGELNMDAFFFGMFTSFTITLSTYGQSLQGRKSRYTPSVLFDMQSFLSSIGAVNKEWFVRLFNFISNAL